ncbi:MAG TPA: hypothetical protein VFZ24_17955 [Longimicrobiales bacterium]
MNVAAAVLLAQVAAAQVVTPVLEFPEPGVDDSAAYEGYRTRFLRDAAGNTVQIYVSRRDGRVVNLWADAANASAGFTLRDSAGRPAPVRWAADGMRIDRAAAERGVEYVLLADPAPLEIGAFLLGSMRLERDFQYGRRHLAPFADAHIEQPELTALIARVDALPPDEQRRHLELLGAAGTDELRARLRARVSSERAGGRTVVRVEQRTFDGRNRQTLVLTFDNAEAQLDTAGLSISVRPRGAGPIRIGVRITTDAATLVPLDVDDIFSDDFLAFRRRAAAGGRSDAPDGRRLERMIHGLELVSSEQKLMAGLPNYATYFGRDMLMSALMLEPIWTPSMIEHVLASVLRKLNAAGEVSHEEALGGQAIRENAAVYNGLIDAYRASGADSLLVRARAVLADLQSVRENYHMVDDDFQLPVLAARYLTDSSVPASRRRAFLLAQDEGVAGTRLERLLRNLEFVARAAAPYARDPVPEKLVAFARRPDGRWSPGSWRDSGAGYGNGRFAMDVNVIWVPQAIEAAGDILAALDALGLQDDVALHLDAGGDALPLEPAGRTTLAAAIETWRGSRRWFEVLLPVGEARRRAATALESLPPAERSFWLARLDSVAGDVRVVAFLALALDSLARPIPVVNTDPATRLFLEDTDRLARDPAGTLRDLDALMLAYPLGLHVPELGPLVANDVYAAPQVRAAFAADLYHSPRVVWGREVNLLVLGLARQIAAAHDTRGRLREPRLAPYVARLRAALERTVEAVDASGLEHNELWSYRIESGRLQPIRYGASTDIQLWNLTDLAVRYALDRLPAGSASGGMR